TAGIAQELASADQSRRGPLIAEYLRGAVAKISGIAADKIGFDVPLATLGLDALMIVALKDVIERDLGLTVSAAVLYARPTLDALLTWIATKLSPAPKSTAIAVPVHNNVAQLREPIAIVGMACRFPAAEDGIEAFWSVLRDGRDVTAEI